MAIKIASVVHHTPVQKYDPPMTECGLLYEPEARYKTSEITCEPCRQGALKRHFEMATHFEARARAEGWRDDDEEWGPDSAQQQLERGPS